MIYIIHTLWLGRLLTAGQGRDVLYYT